MTKKYHMSIPQDVIDTLMKGDYETEGLKHIISYMIENSMTDLPHYKRYVDEYKTALINFDAVKQNFEDRILKPNVIKYGKLLSWNVDFNENEVTCVIDIMEED